MSSLARATHARIDLDALRHNYRRIRALAPASRVLAMVKADAYGHGLLPVAHALSGLADALGVACVPEALALRAAGVGGRIVVMQGFKNADELAAVCAHALDVVIHAPEQLDCLASCRCGPPEGVAVWLKIDTGMHRIGFAPETVAEAVRRLGAMAAVNPRLRYLTHFACADDPASTMTARQIECFDATTRGFAGERSLCNSAALLTRPDAHADWVRPGIALYGASPIAGRPAAGIGLHPVMTLTAPLIAIHHHRAGETIGYGGTFTCPRPMRVGVVAIGYGDGYPRHAASGTPVSIGDRPGAIAGRVSMDMLAIDLGDADCRPGDPVTLWGDGVAADVVATHAQTISYELFCAAGPKAHRKYLSLCGIKK
ncbi:alanine racemase [Acidihalobacter prosperus]|uniref:Alanine racemase n=1 Tax=Acidihalobacter prosperus TaxID=160660 RepID=A0A1A6C2D7_9GAMM|nr:alanine racemase [Acidihalobacter prosperus]OBS08732.1 alanine racemase [Acidihalobacter prosperus]